MAHSYKTEYPLQWQVLQQIEKLFSIAYWRLLITDVTTRILDITQSQFCMVI